MEEEEKNITPLIKMKENDLYEEHDDRKEISPQKTSLTQIIRRSIRKKNKYIIKDWIYKSKKKHLSNSKLKRKKNFLFSSGKKIRRNLPEVQKELYQLDKTTYLRNLYKEKSEARNVYMKKWKKGSNILLIELKLPKYLSSQFKRTEILTPVRFSLRCGFDSLEGRFFSLSELASSNALVYLPSNQLAIRVFSDLNLAVSLDFECSNGQINIGNPKVDHTIVEIEEIVEQLGGFLVLKLSDSTSQHFDIPSKLALTSFNNLTFSQTFRLFRDIESLWKFKGQTFGFILPSNSLRRKIEKLQNFIN